VCDDLKLCVCKRDKGYRCMNCGFWFDCFIDGEIIFVSVPIVILDQWMREKTYRRCKDCVMKEEMK
jgi:hypothetical protein